MENLKIDNVKANKILNSKKILKGTKDSMKTMLDRFEDKFATVDNTGNRLHNNLTNIKNIITISIHATDLKHKSCDFFLHSIAFQNFYIPVNLV